MTSRARTHVVLLALIAASLGTGPTTECAGPAGSSAPPPAATLKLQPQPSIGAGGNAYYAVLVLQVNAAAPLQAYDVDVSFTPGVATEAQVTPHAGFSDDMALAHVGTANLAAGQIPAVVDVRHGPASALAGNLNLAYVLIRVGSRVPIWVQAQGNLARTDGKPFATTPSTRVRVLPPPT